jgi:hypothetical protein
MGVEGNVYAGFELELAEAVRLRNNLKVLVGVIFGIVLRILWSIFCAVLLNPPVPLTRASARKNSDE